MNKISFLLVNYNMRGLIEQCITSIDSQFSTLNVPYEILVVDNSTEPEFSFKEEDSDLFESVTMFFIENKGWTNALNFLFDKMNGEYICICHPDIEFNDGCISSLLNFFEQNTSAGIISPNILYPNGTPCKIRLQFPTLKTESKRLINTLTHILFKRKFMTDELLWDRKEDAKVDPIMSVCMLIRHEIITTMKAIPDDFFLYFANDYICLQAKRQGYNNFYVKDANLIHYERFADESLYSSDKKLDYKKTAAPVLDRMERDKFVFLKALSNRPTFLLFKILSTIEFCVQSVASIKQTRKLSNPIMKKCIDTIKIIWKV